MTRPLEGLEPALLWERFFELTQIARPPKAEGPVREHVLAWASERRLDAQRGRARATSSSCVPAAPGREPTPTVALQAHLDMVCERDPESPYDPREGRIGVVVEGDWVAADGTTLGADDGIGVAAAMAVAEEGVDHGPLELVFTVSEEQGLDGAKALDPSLVASRRLVNLDGTSDDAITVGCAGSDHTFLRLALAPEPVSADETVLRVELSGVQGGHSGADIDEGPGERDQGAGKRARRGVRARPVPARPLVRRRQPERDPREAPKPRSRCRPTPWKASGPRSRRRSRRSVGAYAETDGGVVADARRVGGGRRGGRRDDTARARPARGDPDGRPLARARSAGRGRDQHQPDGGDHRGGDAHPRVDGAQLERGGARRAPRDDARARAARRRGARGAPLVPALGADARLGAPAGCDAGPTRRLFGAEPDSRRSSTAGSNAPCSGRGFPVWR